ncbi:MAG: DUF116 domain-containing protein [Methanobacteriaceae archaeon]|jgi:hypothetical protein|uniref:DUF116 domain-containing protein n=1 Tax=Methanobrevibacter sp. UBA46 TaxID=1915488 RepID=UPI00376250B6|nr:DUF116 domain-containing protein [Methanobacteriaceae archaeon]MDD4594140.1 DUF116 domain-containing protein [Methanobacteriaceae archaeon]
MDNLPYNLEYSNYYKIINQFTNNILNEEKKYLNYITPYIKYSGNKSIKEGLLESLLIGTYWTNYIEYVQNLDNQTYSTLCKLNNLREEKEELKPEIDRIKGYLNTKLLTINNEQIIDLNIDYFQSLLKFLEATGEYKYELKHLNQWFNYFQTLNDEKIQEILIEILVFTDYFNEKAEKYLSKYTLGLKDYLKNIQEIHKNKEDIILCSRNVNEYYLQMFGAEIMNQIYYKEFQERPRKALILPSCMRQTINKCQGKKTPLGCSCQKCDKNCPTYHLKTKADREGFEIYTVTHESDAFKNVTMEDKKEIGIIGVACVLNLINGGWKSYELGMPAQCVILNHVACANHWTKEDIKTDFNQKQLNKIL